MADDVTLNAMSGGSVVATDEIASKHYQRVKLVHGADGINAGDVSTANGLPVQVLSIAAGDNNIGNVDIVSSALPTGAATQTTLAALDAKVTACNTGAVVVSSSALPTGAATSAKQDTAQTALDAIKTAAELIDNAISGNEMQVDIVTMPNVTIANASLPVTDNGGSLTVDAPVGTPVFVRLSDGTSAITTLPVSLASVPSHAVTNAGTFATQVTSIAAGDNNIGNVDVVTLPALPAGTNNIGDVDVLSLPALPAGTNNIGDVDIVSSVLPTGAATAANQATEITALSAIQTAVELLDNTVSSNKLQTDVITLPALPSGTNNIGDVDVLTLPAVHFQDLFVTGQGSQLALGQNIVLASAGTGSFDCLNGTTGISFRQVALQIVPAAGTVTAGVVTFEGSNDNVNFVSIILNDENSSTATPVSAITIAASTTRYMRGALPFRYFRARISTGITGTTTGVQCFSVFSTIPYSSGRLTVTQATASNLNMTVGGTAAITMAAGGTTTPAKAQDGVAGATDTGIPNLLVRRDTPTALTPIAGDYAFGQCSANGEMWVRQNTVPARTRTADAISVAQQTDVLMNGLTALTPKFAKIGAAASGDNTLVAAVASKKIRVLSLFLMSTGTVNAYIRDDAASPIDLIGDATNKLTLVSSSGFVLPPNPLGWCETTSGEGLQLNLSAAIGVAGCLTYVEV